MNIIKIKGGLGNQMFQYAYGRMLILIDKKDVTFDISFFESGKKNKDTYQSFILNEFNIDNSVKFKNVNENGLLKIFKKIISKITGAYGFYQSEKYFKEIEYIIRREFTLKESLSVVAEEYSNKINDVQNSISIHIRRGDYISNKSTNFFHGTCNLDYYERAIDYIKEKVESPTFFIFSDDIEWVKKNLKIDNSICVSNPEIKDYEELILMSKCKHNIIANSTFSWWGAWLNQNPDKIVIGPKQWTVKKTSNELDILPKDWMQM